jgi:alkanesulfonate monooxygenase SsuD/methylene tetrahydromethanopterin reductase-like flavin-dependent oxidoreductase (luciferase family)
VVLGLGAGWLGADYAALGLPFDPAPVRLTRFDEALQVIRQFFTGPTVEFAGRYYTISDLEALPAPTTPGGPPILVGGGGPRVLRIAGRHADIVGVHVTLRAAGFDAEAAHELSLEQVRAKIEMVDRAAAAAGRTRPTFQLTPAVVIIDGKTSATHRPGFTDYIAAHPEEFADSPAVLIGDTSSVADQIRRWQDELGIGLWHLGGDVASISAVIRRIHDT